MLLIGIWTAEPRCLLIFLSALKSPPVAAEYAAIPPEARVRNMQDTTTAGMYIQRENCIIKTRTDAMLVAIKVKGTALNTFPFT